MALTDGQKQYFADLAEEYHKEHGRSGAGKWMGFAEQIEDGDWWELFEQNEDEVMSIFDKEFE